MWRLLYHPESECLFWHEACLRLGDGLDSELLVEIATAPRPSRQDAEFAWSMYPGKQGSFAEVYDAKSEGAAPEKEELDDLSKRPDQWLDEPRWPGGPAICDYENSPAFDSDSEAKEFLEANAPGSTMHKLWKCSKCERWHFQHVPRGPSGSTSGTSRVYVPLSPRHEREAEKRKKRAID